MATQMKDAPGRKFLPEWEEARPKINGEIRWKIYEAYAKHVIGSTDLATVKALGGRYKNCFGMERREMKNDYTAFWDTVLPLLPMRYDQGEQAWLKMHGEISASGLLAAIS